MAHRKLLFPLLALLLALTATAQAEQYREFGDYRVHYSAFKSDMLEPEVAKAHGLSRSRYRALINITVQRKDEENGFVPVHAEVEGSARDIHSKIHKLSMQEVREGTVVYYLGDLPIVDKQRLTFDIRVRPEGSETAHSLRFEQQFFID